MKNRIFDLLEQVELGNIGKALPWNGADVVVSKRAPSPSENSFYPDPRLVETKYVGELSWLFEQLKDIFLGRGGYGVWKEEFFGRLGNAATKFQSVCPDGSVRGLLTAVIEEASTMEEEITREGGLQYLPVTFDNQILDDFVLLSDDNNYLSKEETKKLADLYTGQWAFEIDVHPSNPGKDPE
jgi:hypothetical protein